MLGAAVVDVVVVGGVWSLFTFGAVLADVEAESGVWSIFVLVAVVELMDPRFNRRVFGWSLFSGSTLTVHGIWCD